MLPLLGHNVFVTIEIVSPLVGFDLEPNVVVDQVVLIARDFRPEYESRVPRVHPAYRRGRQARRLLLIAS